jgi:hypothetical protein
MVLSDLSHLDTQKLAFPKTRMVFWLQTSCQRFRPISKTLSWGSTHLIRHQESIETSNQNSLRKKFFRHSFRNLGNETDNYQHNQTFVLLIVGDIPSISQTYSQLVVGSRILGAWPLEALQGEPTPGPATTQLHLNKSNKNSRSKSNKFKSSLYPINVDIWYIHTYIHTIPYHNIHTYIYIYIYIRIYIYVNLNLIVRYCK